MSVVDVNIGVTQKTTPDAWICFGAAHGAVCGAARGLQHKPAVVREQCPD